MSLTTDDLARYKRQISFNPFGEHGQVRLRRAHVLVAGVGGLGSPVAFYLACAGIGKLTLLDHENVELSNLNRQILYTEFDIGQPKVHCAARRLRELNATVDVIPCMTKITSENVTDLLKGVDIVIDCLDSIQGRLVLNKGCVEARIPLIHGGLEGMMGEITTIIPGKTPCLACIFPSKAQSVPSLPVFGCTAGIVASLQVMEAIKLLAGFGKLLEGRMLYIRGEEMQFNLITIAKKRGCEVCDG